MQTHSEQVRLQHAQAKLRISRYWATGLLLAASVLFIMATVYMPYYAWLAYVKAFAESAMVGALADWFAVTALFRRPLGLPIPHTAILPRHQNRIADELARFIEHNFLQGKPIAMRIYQAQPSKKMLSWLEEEQTQQQWLPWLAQHMPVLFYLAKPEQVARFGSMLLAEQYTGEKMGQTLSDGLKLLKTHQLHERLFESLLLALRKWLQSPTTRQLLEKNLREWAAKIESDAPSTWDKFKVAMKSTLVEKIDDWAAEKALDWIDNYLAEASHHPQHTLYQQFEMQYDALIEKLAESPQWHERLEAAKLQLAQSPTLSANMMQFWQGVQKWVENDVVKQESVCLLQLQKLLNHMLNQAEAYPQFMRRIDVRLSLMMRDLVMRYKEKAAQFIADKVKSWDSAQMVEKLELSVGKDLQYIRINGTLVGGLVGLLIYMVSQWIA